MAPLRVGHRRWGGLWNASCVTARQEVEFNEPSGLVASDVLAGTRDHDPLLRLHRRMREDLRRKRTMIYLTAAVSLFLFVYLFAALIRPEWF